MSSNPSKDYKDYVRANLPAGMSYNEAVARYQFNDHSFSFYPKSEWYYNYLVKYGYVSEYSVGQYEPALVLDFVNGGFYGSNQ